MLIRRIHTGSSGVTCSAGGSLRLYAAHKISLDFFKVSSILQAAKSAAPAASYGGSVKYVIKV